MKAGWKTVKLGEVCSFVSRGVSPRYVENEGILVLNQKCVRNHRVSFDLARRHDNLTKPFNEERLLRAGDVLVNSTGTGTLGRVAQLTEDPPEEATVDSHVSIVRPKKELFHLAYFGYAMILIEPLIAEAGKGSVGQTELSREDLRNNFEIPLPPLAEQKRIVTLLDEAFAGIDEAKAKADSNLTNARDLFQSSLRRTFYTEKWHAVELGTICKTSSGGTPHKSHKEYYQDGQIPWLRSGEVNQRDIKTSECFITEIGMQNSAAKLFPINTVLIAMYGATAGQVGILRFQSTTNQAVCGILPCSFSPEFLYYFFLAIKDDLVAKAVGGAQPNISQEKIRGTLIPLVSGAEQNKIVNELDALAKCAQEIERLSREKSLLYGTLKSSLLTQAFAGELTA